MVANDDAGAAWGGGPDMSAWEALMWRAEGDYRTRSTGVVVELLDTEPDWDRLVAAHQRLVERVPRLKERVVEPALPVVAPAWSPDPNFELAYHLQRVRLPGDGTMVDWNVWLPSSRLVRSIRSARHGRRCWSTGSKAVGRLTFSSRITASATG